MLRHTFDEPVSSSLYKDHRYLAEIINHCLWLSHRFPLNFREVKKMMFERGVIVSYETIRKCCPKFRPELRRSLHHRPSRRGEKWHLDEVFLTINGHRHDLWQGC